MAFLVSLLIVSREGHWGVQISAFTDQIPKVLTNNFQVTRFRMLYSSSTVANSKHRLNLCCDLQKFVSNNPEKIRFCSKLILCR